MIDKYKISALTVLRVGFYVVSCLLFAYLAKVGLTYPDFWFDEAGQYFISVGLNHDSAPLAAHGELWDVIENNRFYNLDPGGFSILLFIWLKFSQSLVWMRLLPLLFFLLGLWFIVKLCKREYGTYDVGIAVALLIAVTPLFYGNATELRAYSMEFCGVSCTLFFLSTIKDKLNKWNLLLLGLVVGVFMTSRYCFVIYAFGFSLYVVYLISAKYQFRIQLAMPELSCYALPVLLFLCLVYFGMMKYQNASAEPLFYLPYLNSDWRLFFSPFAVSIYFVITIVLYSIFNGIKISPIFIVGGIVVFAFFIIAVIGKFPWEEKRAFSVMTILYIGILSLIFNTLFHSDCHVVKPSLYIGLILFAVSCKFSINCISSTNDQNLFYDINKYLSEHHESDKCFVSRMAGPDLRFLFEVGAYKDRQEELGYPSAFVFGNGSNHVELFFGNSVKNQGHTVIDPDTITCDYYLIRSDSRGNADMNKYVRVDGYNYLFNKIK